MIFGFFYVLFCLSCPQPSVLSTHELPASWPELREMRLGGFVITPEWLVTLDHCAPNLELLDVRYTELPVISLSLLSSFDYFSRLYWLTHMSVSLSHSCSLARRSAATHTQLSPPFLPPTPPCESAALAHRASPFKPASNSLLWAAF